MAIDRTPYNAAFPEGTKVCIKDKAFLERFLEEWKYHHPITEEYMQYAGVTTTVSSIAFYHGGDELYELNGVPGIWHKQCLEGQNH
jgi:hypothetical protein